MSDRRPLLFNPQQASTQELEATLVRDGPLLQSLERDLLEDRRRGTPRHWQIIAPRGSGKTHLTEILTRRMADKHGWLTVRLPEEHYQVASVADLLEQILVRLSQEASPHTRTTEHEAVEDLVIDELRRRQSDRAPLLVVIENLGLLLEHQLRTPRDQARLRQILTSDPPFILVATATSYISATTDHSAPFYDFFHSISLEDLSRDEVAALVEARARWDGSQQLLQSLTEVHNQLNAIYHLSGGNPRLVVALYNVLRQGVTEELHTQLLQLLDEVTPYFQARMGDVSPQAARILTEMAVSSGPILPADLARRCRLPTNQVTAQLRKLQQQRFVVPGGRPDLRSRYYEVKDRLFRIWLQMREDRSSRGKLQFLTEFFQRWYGDRSDELAEAARRLADAFWEGLGSGDATLCAGHLRTLDYLSRVMTTDSDHIVLDTLAAVVTDGEEDPTLLQTKLSQLEAMYARADSDERRAHIGWVIAEVADKLDDSDRSLSVLRELANGNPTSDRLASRFLEKLNECEEYQESWTTASKLLQQQPRLPGVREARALASVALGNLDEAAEDAAALLNETNCPNCRMRIAMRVAGAIGRHGDLQRGLPLLRATILQPAGDEEALEALMRIAADHELRDRDFAIAVRCWGGLEQAPPSFLNSGICSLSHSGHDMRLALDFVSALASKRPDEPLPQFAVDHLIDISAQLEADASRDPNSQAPLEVAVRLLERRTDAKRLAVAFRRTVPSLARTKPSLRTHLLDLYERLRIRGLLAEDISPYSEARAAMSIVDREKALMALHPEVREAVMLLLPNTNKRKAAHQG